MKSPVSVQPIIITQEFKGQQHRGVDLRSVDVGGTWEKYRIIATENMKVTGRSIDGYGNDYLVAELDDKTVADVIKYIHCHFLQTIRVGSVLQEGDVIAWGTAINIDYNPPRGNSTIKNGGHHLHFEVWKNHLPIDPLEYFAHGGLNVKPRRSHA